MKPRELLRVIGESIRTTRLSAGLTQRELGDRAGIVGKYVSEIERGTRDIPMSTLLAVVERGLSRRLAITMRDRKALHEPQVPAYVEELADAIAGLPEATRRKVVGVVHAIVELVR